MNTLTHEQLVEQTARAQWAVISDDANSWDTLGQDEKDEQFARVRAVISTIAEATKEPTEAMVERARWIYRLGGPNGRPTFEEVYKAMSPASPLYPEGK